MSNPELALYLVLVSTNCIIAYHWAVYGFFESTLDHNRPKTFMYGSVFVGMGAVFVAGYMQKAGTLKLEVITEANIYMACVYLFTPPVILMCLLRLFLGVYGTPEYNRARSATQFWTARNLKFGQILKEEGDNLKNFPRAIKALGYFDKAIAIQRKGSTRYSAKRVFNISNFECYYGGLYTGQCPACGFTLKFPASTDGVEGMCTMCGASVTAKLIGQQLHVSAFGKSAKRTGLSTQNKTNLAVALSEKALLLRMMNRLNEAESANDEALKFVDDALSDNPEDRVLLTQKSLIVFRAAEIAHVKDDKTKARNLYLECLNIDESIGNTKDNDMVTGLINSL